MMNINLFDKIQNQPFVDQPSKERILENWKKRSASRSKKSSPRRKIRPIRKVTKCGCGKHPVNPKGDVYKQHNQWMAQQKNRIEEGDSKLRSVKGTGASIKKFEPTYDFSGEEFEMTAEELRRHKND